MVAFSLTRERAQELIAAVELALTEGYSPSTLYGSHTKSALRVAADRLGIIPQSLRGMVGTPTHPGSIFRRYGWIVDWSLYRPRAPTLPPLPEEPVVAAASTPPVPPPDPVELIRLRDKLLRVTAERDELARRAAAASDLRADVMGLMDLPPPPVAFPARDTAVPHSETVVLFLSDLQWGEVILLDAMDGLNSYNLDIARKRLMRWSAAVIDLLTHHWSGPPPDRVILILGGDLISGGIHLELAKTDELAPLPAVRDVAEHLRQAILSINTAIACPLDVISLPGNHGRTTMRPESKEAATTSLDMLVSDFLEMGLRDQTDITFYAPPSPDALFSVYGWRILATHGDRIGSRGGHGFIGPAAVAARGFKKLVGDYAARGVHLDLVLIGHLHTALQLEEGFVNGCLPGPSEYSRDYRFRPRPATQLFLCVHPRRLIAQIRWLEVGSQDEGTLYEPPPLDRALRPRYRVAATTREVGG